MAGGVNAAIVPCLKCAGAADRTSEGQENDYYQCGECGFEFGIDWSYDGSPQTPCYPISEQETKERREMAARVFGDVLARNTPPREQLIEKYRDVIARALANHEAASELLKPGVIARFSDEELQKAIKRFIHLAETEDELKKTQDEALERISAKVMEEVLKTLDGFKAEGLNCGNGKSG